MGRTHVVTNANAGDVTVVAFTVQEEAEADAAVASVPETKRDSLAEIEELKSVLIRKGVISSSDLVASKR